MMSKLWKDEAGFVVSAELIFIATLLVIGLVTGWVAVRNAVTSELTEVANAIGALDQSYSYCGKSNCCATSAGGGVTDTFNTITTGFTAGTAISNNVSTCP